jgi:hypothetical protein
MMGGDVADRGERNEAVKKMGQAPSRPLIFQSFRSEPVPFFHSLNE